MRRASSRIGLVTVSLLACAHARTGQQDAMVKRGDCAELLRAADGARALRDADLARDLAAACVQDRFDELVQKADPAEGLLWCGRARAAGERPGCSPAKVGELVAQLHPRLTLGPPEESQSVDPALGAALDQVGPEMNLAWSARDPDVIVGVLTVATEHTTSRVTASVPDQKGRPQRVPAVQHRFVSRAEAEVELGGKTRVLRAADEVRDTTWDAVPKLAVAARFEPEVPPGAELRKRAAVAWLRALGKALSAAPPENIDVHDARGCVAYGLSLNLNSGDPAAAAAGNGDPVKIAACEKLLGEPAGAGIPVP